MATTDWQLKFNLAYKHTEHTTLQK
jgi:hypothetical protein